ncbi:dihydrofolate reductase [Actinoplanes campanulatus]|uniref:Dihydrofolate reductase n=1 Tax=Actinoplanes campanulatus TaxID=113559 RepID=A0A7W5FH79_9ACTN|nr:hypothetical protein [Actinoplanes campanulatus]MBB3098408.1 dihydrofolate reductase [Actinoplanes campanulatus]GGN35092.1 hypothetical protein GCM10010109_58770 [Actinoplanes campanulatus]GID39101.1 hypothetical protein Aca09nite_56070 [Actinoplanes campanulatus]
MTYRKKLLVFPIALGSGTRLFPREGKRVDMSLAASRTFDSGVVHLHHLIGESR